MEPERPEDGSIPAFMQSIVDFAETMYLEVANIGVENIDSRAVLVQVVHHQHALATSVLALHEAMERLAAELMTRRCPGDQPGD